MKITRKHFYNGKRINAGHNIKSAVSDATEPSFYDGENDRMRGTVTNLQNMFAKLVDILHDKDTISTDEVEKILNAGDSSTYKIEE